MGKYSSPPKDTSSSTTTVPWVNQQDDLNLQMDTAKQWFQDQSNWPQYYPDKTYIDPSAATQQGWTMQSDMAQNGIPIVNSAENQAQSTLGGDYLYSNPAMAGLANLGYNSNDPSTQYLQDFASGKYTNDNPYLQQAITNATNPMVAQYQTATAPQITQDFVGSGGVGSGAYANAQSNAQTNLASQLAQTANTMSYNNYNQGIQNQLAASGTLGSQYSQDTQNQIAALGGLGSEYGQARQQQLAPLQYASDLADQNWKQAAAMTDVGQQQETYQNAALQDQINRWNYEQTLPEQMLNYYTGITQGNYGGTVTGTTPVYSSGSPLGQYVGAGMAGAGLIGGIASQFGSSGATA